MVALAAPLPATIPSTLAAAVAYRRAGLVDWRVVGWSLAFGLPATALGAYLTRWISGGSLVRVTDVIIAGLGLRFLVFPGEGREVADEVRWYRLRLAAVALVV